MWSPTRIHSRTTNIFIFINGMPLSSHTAQFILFADDTNLLFKSKNLSSLIINVNSELTKNFSLDKCQQTFT